VELPLGAVEEGALAAASRSGRRGGGLSENVVRFTSTHEVILI